jgi:hypothetical protein
MSIFFSVAFRVQHSVRLTVLPIGVRGMAVVHVRGDPSTKVWVKVEAGTGGTVKDWATVGGWISSTISKLPF